MVTDSLHRLPWRIDFVIPAKNLVVSALEVIMLTLTPSPSISCCSVMGRTLQILRRRPPSRQRQRCFTLPYRDDLPRWM
jgi:hypothetical protein